MNDQEAFAIAVEEAKISYAEGGIPVRLPTTLIHILSWQLRRNSSDRLEQLWSLETENCWGVAIICVFKRVLQSIT